VGSITNKIRQRLAVALASKADAAVITDRLAAAEAIPLIGTTASLRTDTLANATADAEARLDALEAKTNAIIAAFKL
jgi:hypothetical protein